MAMKRFLPVVALLLSIGTTFAATTTQKWTAGWGNFNEPLNYKKSKVSWSVNPTKSTLTVTYTLMSATPNKQYGVGLSIFCTTFPATFGQFPTAFISGGNCDPFTFQGVTRTAAGVALGVILTDIHGNGSVSVVVGPIASGTYDLEFGVADGGSQCTGSGAIDFQSPGPIWGDTTAITIP
jgi:hypothetical protein